MWIFLNEAFLSIVVDRNDPNMLMVKARIKGDIERVFNVEPIEDAGWDYRYRTSVPRAEVATLIAKELFTISYDNFKNSVKNTQRHFAYGEVWQTMFDYQRDEEDRDYRARRLTELNLFLKSVPPGKKGKRKRAQARKRMEALFGPPRERIGIMDDEMFDRVYPRQRRVSRNLLAFGDDGLIDADIPF